MRPQRVTQILMVSRYGALMQLQATSPQAFLSMIERLAGLVPSHTRRSLLAMNLPGADPLRP